jgi:hypothetical protein
LKSSDAVRPDGLSRSYHRVKESVKNGVFVRAWTCGSRKAIH